MQWVVACLAALLVPVAAHLGLTGALGAHPFWDQQVAWIGLPIGLMLAVAGVMTRPAIALTGGVAMTALAFWVATTGKARFVTSFAEDTFGGQLWYFGWIAVCASAIATLAIIAHTLWSARRPTGV